MDYKDTLNLPRTDFPMKADLVTREPQRLEKWQAANLYGKIQEARAGAEKFVLHDGPPFANGDVHIGTALNKILKDIIIKYQTISGKHAPYVPGWDCHGLPIEFKVSQEMRKAGDTSADAATIRKACEAYALKYLDIQRAQFKRLGVLGDWENPYVTLRKEYEADELRLFADIVEKGFVYRGKKPVYWSIPCRTALAEAEVEYADHVSQSVYVKFSLPSQQKTIDVVAAYNSNPPVEAVETIRIPENTFLLIWTTTPWTLPANLAVALNSTLDYSLIEVAEERYIAAKGLIPTIAEKCGWEDYRIVQDFLGVHLLGLRYRHPFIKRESRILMGDSFVESNSGTGFVHIAPGHGQEDYNLGRLHGLVAYSPVDDNGCFCLTDDVVGGVPVGQQMPADMIGKSILEKHGKSEANEAVLHELRVRHALLEQENYHHSYPHCWRSKTPIIFRAMDQWFIRIDHEIDGKTFRDIAIEAIDPAKIEWVPGWGWSRIRGAIQSRPDWCISRQRTWGVPIPAFYDAQSNPMLDARIVRNAADLIEKHGSNIWFEKSATELWSLVKPKDWTGPDAAAKSSDTLDVWIDSGSSSRAVTARRKELAGADKPFQADLYLEGSDQHRGWFQSSLLLSLAGNGAPPYKTVLTHGFMVDADREKISKSKQGQGGYEKPQTAEAYVKKYGADVVRLWVASQDFRNDIVVSEERVNKVSETYRGIRNALRYQLSNLYDFDPAKHTVADADLTGLDRWILGEFANVSAEVAKAYAAYEFHVVYQKLSQFIAVELSAIYHDIIKDRCYTDAANSPRRRSTQTALHRLVTGLCEMLSPILVFTADEAWEFVPGQAGLPFVHLATWKPGALQRSDAERGAWEGLFKLRELVLPSLEKERQAKTIGKSLEAKVTLTGSNPLLTDAKTHLAALRELLNVSQLEAHVTPGNGEPTLDIVVGKALGQKCERCWHCEEDVGVATKHPTLCGRCVEAVEAVGK